MNGTGTSNTAGPGANVGIQAQVVRNSNVYLINPNDPPERRYEVGVRYLEHGIPSKAHELITEAIAQGLDNAEVGFHQVLSVLSKRSFRDLTDKDHQELHLLSARLHTYADDEWRRALEAVFALLARLGDAEQESQTTLDDLLALPEEQHRPIVQHLDLMITGAMKDRLWSGIVRNAKYDQHAKERTERVWSYFEPDPAGARAKHPRSKTTTPWTLFWASISGVPLGLCLGAVIWSALNWDNPLVIFSLFLMAAGGYFAFHDTFLWWHHKRILRKKERRSLIKTKAKTPPKGGFAAGVDQDFEYYFSKYAPDSSNKNQWLKETESVRRDLRDEVVHIYRESEVKAGSVRWLIRYMARDVQRRANEDRPIDPRPRSEVGTVTKVRSMISCCVLATGWATITVISLIQAPLVVIPCLLVAGVSVRSALPLWAMIVSENRRLREETAERDHILASRESEHRRWKEKLERLRPKEEEMVSWLNADKTLILDRALARSQLSWHEVVAHAFLQTADRPCREVMVKRGIWRYPRYIVRLFLVTENGIRETEARLDFQKARIDGKNQENFQFDSVSSIRVEEKNRTSYTLHLTLMNGEPKKINVSEPVDQDPENEETTKINLEASGFTHTRRILEGIASEGKSWIQWDRTRKSNPRTTPKTNTQNTTEENIEHKTGTIHKI